MIEFCTVGRPADCVWGDCTRGCGAGGIFCPGGISDWGAVAVGSCPSVGIVLMFLWGLWLGLSGDVCFCHPVICAFCLVVLSLKLCHSTQDQTYPPPP